MLIAHGYLVRTDELSLLRVGVVARHSSFRGIFALLGVGIVLERFARADELPLFGIWVVSRHCSLRSILVPMGVRIILRPLRRH
jgi:hypothetical protein